MNMLCIKRRRKARPQLESPGQSLATDDGPHNTLLTIKKNINLRLKSLYLKI